MLSQLVRPVTSFSIKFQRTVTKIPIFKPDFLNDTYKLTVCGAGGNVGQHLSLLLKQCSLIRELVLYDNIQLNGFDIDLSHIETKTNLSSFTGEENLAASLKDSQVVIITAGFFPEPFLYINQNELFNINACVVKSISTVIADVCPKAMIGIMTHPINSIIPVCAEVLKKSGVYDPKRLFGISTLDVTRTNTLIANMKGLNVRKVNCPVIGGHSSLTMVPVISHCLPRVDLSNEQAILLTNRIRSSGEEVVKAKEGGIPYLSMAYSGARFVVNLLRAMSGVKDIVECTYIDNNVKDTKYLVTPVILGSTGVATNLGIPSLTNYEDTLLRNAIPFLKKDVQLGEQFIRDKQQINLEAYPPYQKLYEELISKQAHGPVLT